MFLRPLLFLAIFPSSDVVEPPAAFMSNPAPSALLDMGSAVPMQATPLAKLETSAHKHHQLLRVKRDFGDPWRDIVLDAWVPKVGDKQLDDVRLWWVESNQDDIRKPFGKKTKKRVTVSYKKVDAKHWVVTFGAGSKKFPFDVEFDKNGNPAVFANMKAGREKVDHCQVNSARLYAKKLLDVTIGLDRLEVECVDSKGKTRVGALRRAR